MLAVTICTIVSLSLLAALLAATGVALGAARAAIAAALAVDRYRVTAPARRTLPV